MLRDAVLQAFPHGEVLESLPCLLKELVGGNLVGSREARQWAVQSAYSPHLDSRMVLATLLPLLSTVVFGDISFVCQGRLMHSCLTCCQRSPI